MKNTGRVVYVEMRIWRKGLLASAEARRQGRAVHWPMPNLSRPEGKEGSPNQARPPPSAASKEGPSTCDHPLSTAKWHPSWSEPWPWLQYKEQPSEPRVHWCLEGWPPVTRPEPHQLEENMDGQQGKNILNNTRSNTAPAETSVALQQYDLNTPT